MSLVQNTPKLVNRAKGPNSMKRSPDQTVLTTQEYRQFIEDLKARVGAARTAAARSVNRDLILL
jgi:hypothetical protein